MKRAKYAYILLIFVNLELDTLTVTQVEKSYLTDVTH